MEGKELRRSMTLSDQLAIEDSPNPKVFPPTVAAASVREKRETFATGSGRGSVSTRTLMDIIKEEHDANGDAGPGINWKSFKERLRLRRAGAGAGSAWAAPPAPISDPEVVVSVRPNPAASLGRSISRSVSVRNAEVPFPGSASRRRAIVSEYNPDGAADTVAEEEGSDSPASGGSRGVAEEGEGSEGSNHSVSGEAAAPSATEEQPVRISLMALLEQTDRWGGDGEEATEEEVVMEEEEVDNEGESGGMYHACCVCMVRHKGAAFIPCGHTFCRLCSRELWVSRGNCPLCNGFILEILDIF